MANVYTNVEPYGYESGGILKRVSWGALFAGLVVALVVELVLSLLGLGIGLGSIKPATEENPFGGIGIGAGIWMGISTLIALFVGGWVTAKLAGSIRGLNGVLHSIVMWGLVTLVSFYLMTTAVGALISGAAGILGKGLSAVSSGASAVAPEIRQQLSQKGVTPDSVMDEARQLLGKGGGSAAGGGAAEAGDQDLKQAVQNIFKSGQTSVSPSDRNALVNALTARTNMSRPEAEKKVDSWIQQYQQTAQSAQQTKQKALQTTQTAMQGLSKASIWIFVLMVLEAIAAALGGWLGARREPLARVP